jgi:hypothetical protein
MTGREEEEALLSEEEAPPKKKYFEEVHPNKEKSSQIKALTRQKG